MEKITIDIDEQGNVRVEGHGIVGQDCEALTRDLEEALGVVETRKRKPEYYRTATRARTAQR